LYEGWGRQELGCRGADECRKLAVDAEACNGCPRRVEFDETEDTPSFHAYAQFLMKMLTIIEMHLPLNCEIPVQHLLIAKDELERFRNAVSEKKRELEG